VISSKLILTPKKSLPKRTSERKAVEHLNMLYNYEADVMYCFLEAPSMEAVGMNHAKLGYICDWITMVKTPA
jgi:hypothetical protein